MQKSEKAAYEQSPNRNARQERTPRGGIHCLQEQSAEGERLLALLPIQLACRIHQGIPHLELIRNT